MADKSFDVVIVGGGNKGLVAGMYLHLRGNLVGQNLDPICHHRRRGLITGGLNTQDFHTSGIIA